MYETNHMHTIIRAAVTQAKLTLGRVDSGADLTSGQVDPLPISSGSVVFVKSEKQIYYLEVMTYDTLICIVNYLKNRLLYKLLLNNKKY